MLSLTPGLNPQDVVATPLLPQVTCFSQSQSSGPTDIDGDIPMSEYQKGFNTAILEGNTYSRSFENKIDYVEYPSPVLDAEYRIVVRMYYKKSALVTRL